MLLVGAASSRDKAMLTIASLFFAAVSRSHEKSSHFGVVSHKIYSLHKRTERSLRLVGVVAAYASESDSGNIQFAFFNLQFQLVF